MAKKAQYLGNQREERIEERIDPGIHQRALYRKEGHAGEERAENKVHPGIEREVKRIERGKGKRRVSRKRTRSRSRSSAR